MAVNGVRQGNCAYHHMRNDETIWNCALKRPILCAVINYIQLARVIHIKWDIRLAINALTDHLITAEHQIVQDYNSKCASYGNYEGPPRNS